MRSACYRPEEPEDIDQTVDDYPRPHPNAKTNQDAYWPRKLTPCIHEFTNHCFSPLRYGQRGHPFGNFRDGHGTGERPPLPPRIGATSRPMYYWHVVPGFWLRVCVGRTSPTSAVPAPAAAISRHPARRFNVGRREEATLLAKSNPLYCQRSPALLPEVRTHWR